MICIIVGCTVGIALLWTRITYDIDNSGAYVSLSLLYEYKHLTTQQSLLWYYSTVYFAGDVVVRF